MYDNLFSSININPENVHVPSGVAKDVEAHCQWYEEEIRKAGGIDVQVLGIGSDGHVQDNARFFDREEDVPRFAITMGVGTILEARHCLLLANGEKKADAVAKFVEGPITSQITASALQMHPNTTVILDEDAASKLERAEHHKWVYENKRKL
jgi:glucosamine-6-phosphate deaminase